MDQLEQKVDGLEKKIDELQRSVDKIKKIFLWTLILSFAILILPIMGLFFIIPQFLSNYTDLLQ